MTEKDLVLVVDMVLEMRIEFDVDNLLGKELVGKMMVVVDMDILGLLVCI